MKKCILLLLAVALISSLLIGVSAAQLPVVDNAKLLTEQEQAKLSERFEEISQRQQADVVVLTVNTLNGQSAETYAETYYDNNQYADDGMLLLVSINDRLWYISGCGRCADLIDYWGADYIASYFLSELSDGNYFDAFQIYGSVCDNLMGQLDPPSPKKEMITGKTVLICLAIGFVVGLITVLIMRAQLKSVRAQGFAGSYVVPGSFAVTKSRDIYLYRNVVRREKPKSNSSSGGGGRRHSGGGGSF